ncbi:ParB/RepB/Spo0J family partition protein [Singulisphaera acidiphila]|uniref:ParB-like partition protein n=1 Tax=Singulisphaera acidiphila (strain ATCC BAA-1392 / DSM 18658 / VKM B-2454 / MOB10) TaxID=886293 RepID=L0DRR9_SINAD|nr:ParB/RepB/Spo0J family partition protein [Singulisphaera acidiphila]AGA31690.1 ParB-like partition protein [Singulisphaera acidiphila DSM 18658]
MPDTFLSIGIDQLMPDPTQPRKTFLKEEIERLAASVAARGMLQPLRVMFDETRGSYLIVTGESRYRAGLMAGMAALPCLLVEGQPDEAELLADRIVENSCRHDLRPLELARSLAKLRSLKKCTSGQLAVELGLSGASVCRAEALLSLPGDIQSLVDGGSIPESTAYELSRLPNEQSMRELALAVTAGKLSRDQVADAVRASVGKRHVRPKSARLPLRLDGGISVTVSAGQPLTWDDFNTAIDRIRKEAKKLYEGGKDITELARSLKAS